ncbi:hypothetical protein BGZ46_003033 [Entomortierella lignicola]|nr:hypothetical protein BGZ46_003033 [Entomortierella lignicola]
MILFITSRSTATLLCSLVAAVVLSWSLLALKATARNNINDLKHLPSPQFFPTTSCSHVENSPHPTNCVQHKSGVYLAITSIGHGFPRVQFTCTQAHHNPLPTTSLAIATQEQDLKQTSIATATSPYTSQSKVHNPVEAIPEQTPQPSSYSQEREEKEQVKEDGRSTVYADLHLTKEYHSQQQQRHNNKGLHSLPKFDFIFSPREGSLKEAEIHTTTQSYTEDDNQQEKRTVPLTKVMKDDPASTISVGIGKDKWQITTNPEPEPEPSATILVPTSSSTTLGNYHEDEPRSLSNISEKKIGPPLPTPEPLPAQVTGASFSSVEQREERQQHCHKVDRQQDQHLDSSGKVHRVICRVTTLIIQTETVIVAPVQTTSSISL